MSNSQPTPNVNKGAEINVAYLAKAVLSKWWVILLSAVFFALVGFGFSELTKTVTYSSNISFVVSNRHGAIGDEEAYSSSDLNASITLANTYKYILSSRTMCEKVAQSCSYETTAEQVSKAISLSTVTNTNIIVMTITTGSPAKSYDYALAVIKHYGEIVENSGYPNSSITVCEHPIAATHADSDISVLMYCLVGAFVGLMLALILILILNMMKNTVQSAEDIQRRLDLRIIGLVSRTTLRGNKNAANKALLMDDGSVGFSFVETYKAIRTKLENIASKKGYKVFLVSSAGENEGKTTVSTNLAISLAQNGHSVLLIDADLRKPSVCKHLSLNNTKENRGHGLPDVLSGKSTFEHAIRYVERHKIFLLAGSNAIADASEMLSTEQMERAVRSMRNEFDFVIIDTAPAAVVTDASVLTNYADAVVFVIREDCTPVEKIQDAIDDLTTGKAELVGCVYNNVTSTAERTYNHYTHRYTRRYSYGSYGYGYGYGYGKKPEADDSENNSPFLN